MLTISQKRFFVSWDELSLVCATWYKIINDRVGVRRAGEAKRAFALRLEIGIRSQIFLQKPEVGILIPINWFDSCNDSFFACMKLTLRRSQVHSCSVMQWWAAVHSYPLLCLQRWVAKVANKLFYCWSLLRNNNRATNLQRFTLYYGGRRFVAWDCWMHTSWQVMQQDSDMLITVSHVHLYFVKRSMSESVAMLP